MSGCLDCDDKAREKNKKLDEFRSTKITEPMAICMTPEGYEFIKVEEAIINGMAIKQVLFPQ